MGLSPEQLAGLTPFMFEIKVKGWKEGQYQIEQNFRKMAWIYFGVNSDPKAIKNVDLDDLWPTFKSIKKAKERNEKASEKVYASMMDAFKKRKGLK